MTKISLPTSDPPHSSLNSGAPTYTPAPNPSDPALWTYLSKHVLLQTATAVAFNPDDPSKAVQIRIVLDTGSQSSYLTNAVQDQLSLTVDGE